MKWMKQKNYNTFFITGVSLVVQMVKKLPVMQETWVRFLGWEDTRENGMATHSSILSWEISWTEESGGPQSMESQRVDMTQQLTHSPECQ